MQDLLEAKVAEAPEGQVENLCIDASYTGKKQVSVDVGYVAHIRPRGEEKKTEDPAKKPRHWVVELAHSWFNRYLKLTPRREKTDRSYMGLAMLTAEMIMWNKIATIYG